MFHTQTTIKMTDEIRKKANDLASDIDECAETVKRADKASEMVAQFGRASMDISVAPDCDYSNYISISVHDVHIIKQVINFVRAKYAERLANYQAEYDKL